MNVSVSDKTRLVEDSFNKLISELRPKDEARQVCFFEPMASLHRLNIAIAI